MGFDLECRHEHHFVDGRSLHKSFLKKVRIVTIQRGSAKAKIIFFYGRVRTLNWNPNRLYWNNEKHTPFMNYSTSLERGLLRNRNGPLEPTSVKWNNLLPPDFVFNWGDIWAADRARKEASLQWLTWHKGIAVNV